MQKINDMEIGVENENSDTGAVEIQGYLSDALLSMIILPVVLVMETAMLLRG